MSRSNALDSKLKKVKILKSKNFSFSQSADGMVSGTFIVQNERGLHTRPSTELVKCAASFDATITLYYRDHTVNGKSLLGILMLAAEKGSKIKIEAIGADAEKAVLALLQLAQNKFNIKY